MTIWGESAGGGSVLALQGARSAEGLFHRSIAFSPGDIAVAGAPDGAAAPADYQAFLDELLPDATKLKKMERTWYDLFRSSSLRNAQAASAAGAGGWVYNFDVPTDDPLGVTHASDIAFTFNAFAAKEPGILFHENTDTNRKLAEVWSASMVRFARTGDPNGAGLPQWPRYDSDTRACLIFDDQPHIESDPDGKIAREAYGLS